MAFLQAAQRWFNGSMLLPAENGYSRALVGSLSRRAGSTLVSDYRAGQTQPQNTSRSLPFLVNVVQNEAGG
ncbi:MAG: hypothetical protein D6737_18610 [Chloroflexi bacterium]|nr:MAG: hypothetical protein CUN54_05345 [Phototrophicales bacterium]RMF77138.1 MAG: hypothetical protein D6737_18610 [Chloroflexota bacterium]